MRGQNTFDRAVRRARTGAPAILTANRPDRIQALRAQVSAGHRTPKLLVDPVSKQHRYVYGVDILNDDVIVGDEPA